MLTQDTTWKRKAKREGWLRFVQSDVDEIACRQGYYFDKAAAQRVFNFFERVLRHSKGMWGGQPFLLQPWQKDELLGPIFGWKRPDGLRRFRRVHVELPKKNGKSTLAAGVGLYMLRGDGENGADVFSAATKKEQAALVHNEAITMVKVSPLLSRQLKINETTKVIAWEETYSRYSVLAADAEGAEGLNIHALICDELHVWRGRKFWDSLRYGFAARKQALHFTITTAGIYDPTSLGYQEHEYAERVGNGSVIDLEFFPYIRAADKTAALDESYLSAEQHKKANPNYNVTIQPEEIAKAAADAKEKISERGPFLRYRLNLWVDEAESFFDMDRWRACSDPVDESKLVGRRCFGGLDLASKNDIAAWILLFPPTTTDVKWRVLCRFFVPQDNAVKREAESSAKYATWRRQGLITLTPGNTIDYEVIRKQIIADFKRFDIVQAGADPWNLEYIRQLVAAELNANDKIIPVEQTFRELTNPTKELERLVLAGLLAHGGSEVLTWMAGNAVPREDENQNIKISRKRSKEKIDGIAALINALSRAMVARPSERRYQAFVV
jgi:phage terminase large subunit-like protein